MFTEDLRAGCWPQGFVFVVGTRFRPSEGLQWLLKAALLTEQFCVIFMWKIQTGFTFILLFEVQDGLG